MTFEYEMHEDPPGNPGFKYQDDVVLYYCGKHCPDLDAFIQIQGEPMVFDRNPLKKVDSFIRDGIHKCDCGEDATYAVWINNR